MVSSCVPTHFHRSVKTQQQYLIRDSTPWAHVGQRALLQRTPVQGNNQKSLLYPICKPVYWHNFWARPWCRQWWQEEPPAEFSFLVQTLNQIGSVCSLRIAEVCGATKLISALVFPDQKHSCLMVPNQRGKQFTFDCYAGHILAKQTTGRGFWACTWAGQGRMILSSLSRPNHKLKFCQTWTWTFR